MKYKKFQKSYIFLNLRISADENDPFYAWTADRFSYLANTGEEK